MQDGYICVYRRRIPTDAHWKKTRAAATSDRLLEQFLAQYNDSFYDWGDDPAFYCATEITGDVNNASWGVCRRDVRENLKPDDVVVFFCAKPRLQSPSVVDYHYVGVGTVKAALPRRDLWTDSNLAVYRQFYNVLAELRGSSLIQKETFHPYHKNWEKRAGGRKPRTRHGWKTLRYRIWS
jgi:hypothetical protein